MAREVGSRGITVNVVAPGFIDTDMTRQLDEDIRNGLVENIPLNRLGDVARHCRYSIIPGFVSGQLPVTGETLHVNGGMYMI